MTIESRQETEVVIPVFCPETPAMSRLFESGFVNGTVMTSVVFIDWLEKDVPSLMPLDLAVDYARSTQRTILDATARTNAANGNPEGALAATEIASGYFARPTHFLLKRFVKKELSKV